MYVGQCILATSGIFAARVVTPFKMLSFNLGTGVLAGTILSVFGDKSPDILWIFTAILGLAYSTTTPGVFSWAANHLPSMNKYFFVVYPSIICWLVFDIYNTY